MSFLNKLFGTANENAETPKMQWRFLTDLGQLNEINELSHEKPVVIFKHSTRCSISRFVLKQFENEYQIPLEEATPYFLDLISYREVSNEIANRFEVVHQSPQVVVIKKGKAHYDASHEAIDAFKVKSIL